MSDRLRSHPTKIDDGIGKTPIVDGKRTEIRYLGHCNDVDTTTTGEIWNDQFQGLPFSWTCPRPVELRCSERNCNPALKESGREERLNTLRCGGRCGLGRYAHAIASPVITATLRGFGLQTMSALVRCPIVLCCPTHRAGAPDGNAAWFTRC